ncbi:hypothetical protein GCM10009760_09220 [Kitasatospora kazusensis]|uniref:Uncharacterized protein n=1 Tax=Kitasatospora kazusensis TaxID=407974 RepID=A0ABN2YVX7_9ACTN
MSEVGQEVLELGRVVPSTHTQVESELVECLGVGRQFGVSDLADEGGRVVAVDEPVRILPCVEAGVQRVTCARVSSLTPSRPYASVNSPSNRSAELPSAMHQGQNLPLTSWAV